MLEQWIQKISKDQTLMNTLIKNINAIYYVMNINQSK